MKEFIKRLFLFTLFCFLFLVAGIIAWSAIAPYILKKNIVYAPATHAHMYTRIKDVKTTTNVDLLFIGSSVSYRGFDTRIFKQYGYTSFNLGSSNQTHLQSEVLLKQYLTSLNPKLVVYEVSPIVFEVDGVESGLDLISNDKIDLATFQMALHLNNMKVYNSLLYAYFKQITTGYQNLSEPLTREILTYVKGGYEESPMRYYKSDSTYLSREYVFKNSQLSAFKRNLKMLKQHRIPFILVQAPNTKPVYNAIKNKAEIDSLFYNYGTYYNFNNEKTFIDSLHFYDHGHLNQEGVVLFNKELIALLKNHLK